MPLKDGYSTDAISANIRLLHKEGRTAEQSVAIALKEARESFRASRHSRRPFPSYLKPKSGEVMIDYAKREEKHLRLETARMAYCALIVKNGVVADPKKLIAQTNLFVDALIEAGLWPEKDSDQEPMKVEK